MEVKSRVSYLIEEYAKIIEAKRAYVDAVRALQASCEHPTILKHTTSTYLTFRICENCGYCEESKWDSPYNYNDKRLLGRAYDVTWSEYYSVKPKVRFDDPDVVGTEAPISSNTVLGRVASVSEVAPYELVVKIVDLTPEGKRLLKLMDPIGPMDT